MWLCIKGAEADGRGRRSTERTVASHRNGIENQRGLLGGRVSNIGLHVQQGWDVNFHGEARQVPIPTAGGGREWDRRTENNQRDLQPTPLRSFPLSSPGLPRPPLTPDSSTALSAFSCMLDTGPSLPILFLTLELNCTYHSLSRLLGSHPPNRPLTSCPPTFFPSLGPLSLVILICASCCLGQGKFLV